MEPSQVGIELQTRLLEASRRLSVVIDGDNFLYVGRSTGFVLVSVAQGFEQIDPADYRERTTLGIGYIDVPWLRYTLTPGFYALVTNVDEIRLGDQRARVDIVDDNAVVRASLVAYYRVTSLRVPSDAEGIVRLRTTRHVLLDPPRDDNDDICVGITWECDNGSEICIGLVVDPTPIDPPPNG